MDNLKRIKHSLIKNKNLIGWTKYYMSKSYMHQWNKKLDSAWVNAVKAIDYYKQEEGYPIADQLIHKAYYIKGVAEFHENKIITSLKTLYKGLEYTKYVSEKSWKSYIIHRLSIIHIELGDLELALKMMKESAKDQSRLKYSYEGGGIYLDIGILHGELGEIDSSKVYLKKAITTLNNPMLELGYVGINGNFHNFQVMAYRWIGHAFVKEKNIDSAYIYYNKAYRLFKNEDLANTEIREINKLSSLLDYGFILIQNDSLDKAITTINTVKDSLRVFENYNREEKNIFLKTYKLLSEIYSKKEEHRKALVSEQRINNYLNTYSEKNITKQIQRFTTEYELREKEDSISKLTKLTNEQHTILNQKNTINWILGILLISLSILAFVIFKQRKLRNRYKTASLEQRLLRSQLNPHFLFNSLGSIVSLSYSKSDKVIPYTIKLSNLLRSILENSREEFIPLEEELTTIENYLDLQSNFSVDFKYDVHVQTYINIEKVLVPPMFIQPFIENAILHGIAKLKDGKIIITININNESKTVKCTIEDNGVGYLRGTDKKKNTSEYHKSISTEIMTERLKIYSKLLKVNTQFEIKDKNKGLENKGTTVTVLIPFIIED